MKNKSLKLFITIGIITAFFTSCLGDSKSTAEIGSSIAYIKTSDQSFLNYGLTSSIGGGGMIPITAGELLTLRTGYFYKLDGYNIDWNNNNGEAYNVTNVKVTVDDPIPMTERVIYEETKIESDNEIYPTGIGILLSSPLEKDLDDKYVFFFSCTVDKADMPREEGGYSDNIELVAKVIKDNQKNKNAEDEVLGEDLPENKTRINLTFRRINDTQKTGETATYTSYAVVDLGEIREKFVNVVTSAESEDENYYYGWIEFEVDLDKGESIETQTLGDLSNINNAYLMAFPKETSN